MPLSKKRKTTKRRRPATPPAMIPLGPRVASPPVIGVGGRVPRAANGGNIYNGTPDTSIVLKNTVLADSAGGGNCKGKALTSSKYSLSTDSTCGLTGTGDLNNTPALLNPLAWVGGGTRGAPSQAGERAGGHGAGQRLSVT